MQKESLYFIPDTKIKPRWIKDTDEKNDYNAFRKEYKKYLYDLGIQKNFVNKTYKV